MLALSDSLPRAGSVGIKMSTTLEVIQQRIRERLTAKSLSANQASRNAAQGLSFVNDILSGKSKNPDRARLIKLAKVLECDVEYLYGEIDTPDKPDYGGQAQGGQMNRHLPLYSASLPDAEGFFTMDEGGNRMVQMPMQGQSEAQAFCVAVPDDSMAPRYHAGEIVVVYPTRPASTGGYALVRLTDDRVSIRRVERVGHDVIRVATLDGRVPVDLPRETVKALHRIVVGGEIAV